jgi:Polyketide cyclase / dehydrase and lipid transport
MAEVLVSSVVNAPADGVWELVGDFNGFDAWCPFVAGSRITNDMPADAVGCVREITQEDGLKFLEVLVALSKPDRSLSYTFVGSPIPVESHRTTVRLLPITDGDRTYFEWSSRFEAAPEQTAQLVPIMQENFLAGARALQEQMSAS